MKFIGIDPAGDSNTWISILELRDDKLYLDQNPRQINKNDVVREVIDTKADCVVIDGPLTFDIEDDNGWRITDLEMKNVEGIDKNWVQSSNSMMAVPVVSRMIAEYLQPHCATIFETHPRICLHIKYKNDERLHGFVKEYKSNRITIETRKYMTSCLSLPWIEELKIVMRKGSTRLYHDGELDSLVCSIIGYYHYFQPEILTKLSSGSIKTRGFGPAYILR